MRMMTQLHNFIPNMLKWCMTALQEDILFTVNVHYNY